MSKTTAVFPIVRALSRAREFGKAESPWSSRGDGAKEQERYIPLLESLDAQCNLFSAEELKAIASDDVDVINFWLKKNGFDIELKPFTDPDDFGTAAIMSVLCKWKHPGEERHMYVDDDVLQGARLEEGVTYSRVEGYEHPIAHIQTENGDVVHLCIADGELEGLDLIEKLKGFTDKGEDIREFDGLQFPKVSLDQEVDISFFEEMGFEGTGARGGKGRLKIKEAKQQTKFKMNHLGAKAESAAAFSMGLECCFVGKPDMIIDKPFFAWMTRPGLDVPYFAGYISKEDWKDPGEIK